MSLAELNSIWDQRAHRLDPLQAVMSDRWTPQECYEATVILKQTLYTALGQIQGKKILEVGSGVGRFTHDLASLGASMTGIDLSMEMIHRAYSKENNNPLLINGSAHSLPFSTGYFDRVFEVTVFNHLVDDQMFVGALKELKRAVRSGGMVICFDPVIEDYPWGGPSKVTKLRSTAEYEAILGLQHSSTKVLCVDDTYRLMIWENVQNA